MIDWIFCHLVGDYVLPFRIVYGADWRLIPLLIAHIIIDALKARYEEITYTQDQVLHYVTAFLLYGIVR